MFLGHIVMAQIQNQKRYEQALLEILQYLKTHDSEVDIKFDSNYCTISAKEQFYDVVHIPFQVNHLKTCYYRIYHGINPSEDVKIFGGIAWEVMNILKEHFPSKIHIYQENLEICDPYYKPLTTKEEVRRQASCLEARKETQYLLTVDELEDLWAVLDTSIKINDFKIQTNLLETLLNPEFTSNARLVQSFCHELIHELIEKEQSQSLFKVQELSINLKTRYEDAKRIEESKEEEEQEASPGKSKSISALSDQESTFERPMSMRVCMFQINESNNLERITNLLQNLHSFSSENLFKLAHKYDLDQKLIRIIQKYCNGDYGFDLNVSKIGSFQRNYFRVIMKTFTTEVLVDKLADSDFFELYGQLIQEALIFAYDYTFKIDMPAGCKIFEFLRESLDIFNLLMNPKFLPNLSGILEIFAKLQERLQKVSMSGENSKVGSTNNDFLMKFLETNFTKDTGVDEIDVDKNFTENNPKLQENLVNCCPKLSGFGERLVYLRCKFEAIAEYTNTSNHILPGLFGSNDRPLYNEGISKIQTEELKFGQDTNYGIDPTDPKKDYTRLSRDYVRSYQDVKNGYYDKENLGNRINEENEYKRSKNSKEISHKSFVPREPHYYSGQNYNERPLDYNGSYKLKTCTKDRHGRDLDTSPMNKDSVASPISYQSNNAYVEEPDLRYGETHGRTTFQRNPYE
ncbi:unnamed protein product [Moneuplotes crassus]|uniref:Uncharacterized protein n=1 Tax=Euplotes crassus TaxID=5936 RepID=A0AAD1X5C8_EUPCR|nr:unnamed protein product [Moneuplotes crassus]